MAVETFPTLSRRPSAMQWGYADNAQSFVSPLDKTTQTLELVGTRWTLNMTYLELGEDDTAELQAFLGLLNGRSGRFYVPNFVKLTPKGSAQGNPSPSVAAPTAAGDSIIQTTNWVVNQPQVLKKSDLIQVGDELKLITADASSDSFGDAALSVFPPVRGVHSLGASIITNEPKARMRLVNGRNSWSINPPILNSFRIVAIESFV